MRFDEDIYDYWRTGDLLTRKESSSQEGIYGQGRFTPDGTAICLRCEGYGWLLGTGEDCELCGGTGQYAEDQT